MSQHSDHHEDHSLAGKVLSGTGVSVAKCYQCGKCSAGCPMTDDMDYSPSAILRLLQTGFEAHEEKVLRSQTIWLCLTCETCIARCPMDVDLPPVMDFLRQESMRRNIANPKSKSIIKFHQSFLKSIQETGRLYEIGLVINYKLRTMKLFDDIMLAPAAFMKGKLSLLPELIKGRKNMKQIFKKTINK